MSYLVDTNVLSEILKTEPNKAVVEWFSNTQSESLYISVLSLSEIRKGIEKLGTSKRRSRLVLWLEQEMPSWFEDRVIAIDAPIAERWGFILARSKIQVPVIDSLIAATALVHNLKIVTRNAKDFVAFPDLEYLTLGINPSLFFIHGYRHVNAIFLTALFYRILCSSNLILLGIFAC